MERLIFVAPVVHGSSSLSRAMTAADCLSAVFLDNRCGLRSFTNAGEIGGLRCARILIR